MKINQIQNFMDIALEEAKTAFYEDEVPVGCVIISEHGEILAQTYNLKESHNDASAHAEILAIKEASSKTEEETNTVGKVVVIIASGGNVPQALPQGQTSHTEKKRLEL